MNLTPTTPVDDDNTEPGPFIELSRESWAVLSDSTEIDIDEATLDHIRGLGDPTSPIVPLLRGRGGCRTLSPSIMRMSGCRTTSCWLGTMS